VVKFGELRLQSRAAGMASAIALPFFLLPFGHWDTAQPESFQMPFLTWALALWPASSADPSAGRRCAATGLLMGGACLFKTPAALLGLALVAERLLVDWRSKEAPGRFHLALRTAAAMAVLPAAAAIYYAVRGAGADLFDALFVFSPSYARRYSDFTWAWHSRMLPEKIGWSLPLAARLLLGLGIVRGCLLRRKETAWLGVVAFVTTVEVVMQAKYISYHLLLMVPVYSMGIGLAFVPGPAAADPVKARRIALAVTVILAMPLALLALFESCARVA